MTDEQLDERIRGAYEHAELSPDAEERILANLRAAEAARDADKPAGAVAPFPSKPRRRHAWIAPSIAAVLLIGVFVGGRLIPSLHASNAPDGAASEMSAEAVDGAAFEAEDAHAHDPDAPHASGTATVVLTDGRRLAVREAAPAEVDSDELVWKDAVVEDTGATCQAAARDGGGYLVRFEGDETLYEAVELE